MPYNDSMPISSPQSALTAHLQAPWPTDAQALDDHCTQLVELLHKTDPDTDTWVGTALSTMPPHQWWALWVHASTNSDNYSPMPQAIEEHLPSRVDHLFAHPDVVDNVVVWPTYASRDQICQALLTPARIPRTWTTHSPSDMSIFVRKMVSWAPDFPPENVLGVWRALLMARTIKDTPELAMSTRQLWELAGLDRMSALENMVVRMGHTPELLNGFLPTEASEELFVRVLRSVVMGSTTQNPPHMSVMAQLAATQTQGCVISVLPEFVVGHPSDAWTLEVLDVLWRHAGLSDDQRTPDQSAAYVSVLAGLAFRGLIDELTRRLTQNSPPTLLEELGVVEDMAQHPKPHTGAALYALVSNAPPDHRLALLKTFSSIVDLHKRKDRPHLDAALVQAWDLLDTPGRVDLISAVPALDTIPELAAWHQRHILEGHTHAPTTPAGRLKM